MARMKTGMVVLVGLAALMQACGSAAGPSAAPGSAAQPAGKPKGPSRFPVEVQSVVPQKVDHVVAGLGTLTAFEEVQVTARVAGVLDQVRFKEGDVVKAGAVLGQIDADRYAVAVQTAQAQLQRAQTTLEDAQQTQQRRKSALQQSPGLYPAEEMQAVETRALAARADVAAAEAGLRLAEINLRDAVIRAPVGGVMQTRTAQTGQYVQPGAVLGTLLRRDPLLLRFEVSDRDATQLVLGQQVTFEARGATRPLGARIHHVAASANPSTRMVTVMATVDPQDEPNLRPGSFAQVSALVKGLAEGPVVPQTAVRPTERGFVAYVVVQDTAEERLLQLGQRTLDGRVQVLEGLQAGDLVVVRGAEALRPGVQVTQVPSAAPQKAGEPGTTTVAPSSRGAP